MVQNSRQNIKLLATLLSCSSISVAGKLNSKKMLTHSAPLWLFFDAVVVLSHSQRLHVSVCSPFWYSCLHNVLIADWATLTATLPSSELSHRPLKAPSPQSCSGARRSVGAPAAVKTAWWSFQSAGSPGTTRCLPSFICPPLCAASDIQRLRRDRHTCWFLSADST